MLLAIVSTICLSIASTLYYAPYFLLITSSITSSKAPKSPSTQVPILFAIIISLMNITSDVSLSISGALAGWLHVEPAGNFHEDEQFENIWLLNLVTVGVKLIPIGFLTLIDKPLTIRS